MHHMDTGRHNHTTADMAKGILCVCVLMLLCACRGRSNQMDTQHVQSGAVEEVVVGYLPTATHNSSYQRGLSIALDEANQQNLILDGKKIRFSWQSVNHHHMQSLTHTLTDSKWNAVVGQLGTEATAIAQKIGLPAVSLLMDDVTAESTAHAGTTVFHIWPTLSQQGKLTAQYLFQQNIRKVVLVSHNRSSDLTRALQTQLQVNGQLAGRYLLQRMTPKTWQKLTTRLAAVQPDLVFYDGDAVSAAQWVQRLQQKQILIPLMMTADTCNASFIRHAGQFASGSMAIAAGLPLKKMQSSQGFINAYRQKYHQEPNIAAAYAYDAARVIINAMTLAGSTAPQIYLPRLRTLNIQHGLLSGSLTFDRHGRRNEMAMTVYQVEEDKWLEADIVRTAPSQTEVSTDGPPHP